MKVINCVRWMKKKLNWIGTLAIKCKVTRKFEKLGEIALKIRILNRNWSSKLDTRN